jgi:inosine-uridine nucleoside N-ribohydrolase
MAPRKIVIDTDPGRDDAVALLLALASPAEIAVLGITAVAGNVPLALTERNARAICELAGRTDLEVAPGCARPLLREPLERRSGHGGTGLGRLRVAEPQMRPQETHAVDYLIETLLRNDPGTVTLCALGPLTNIAMALRKEPRIAATIEEVVLMGGAFFEHGNVTPVAEFNIWTDPHAALILLESGAPITMFSLDVTHKVLSRPERIERLANVGNRCGDAVGELLGRDEEAAPQRFAGQGYPLHDPCVIAYLLRPDLFRGRKVHVTVETGSPLTLGMTVVDWWGVTNGAASVRWMTEGDADGFYDLLCERIAWLP